MPGDIYCKGVFVLSQEIYTVKVCLFYLRGYTVYCVCLSAGDVECGLGGRSGGLEVEVVQAGGLSMKPGSKGPPGIIS